MGLLRYIFRAADSGTTSHYGNASAWLLEGLSGGKSVAGQTVNPDTAMQLSAYYACLRNIAEDTAVLPLLVYRRLEPRGKDRAPEHPAYRLLHDQPNVEMDTFTFRSTMTGWCAGWGNAYAEIERTGRGGATALWPIHPSRVIAKRDAAGEIVYLVRNEDGAAVQFSPADMLHLRGFGDGLTGYSVLRFAAVSVGLGLAAQALGASFFEKGAKLGGVLIHPGKLTAEAKVRLRESWREAYGGASKAGQTAVLEEGMEFKPISIPPDEAQWLETREFQVSEVARWFRMPLNKIGQHTQAKGWGTLAAEQTDYVTSTLMPWLVRWEKEIGMKLFGEAERERYFAEHLVNGLMRGDPESRSVVYERYQKMGVLSANEIREFENLNPREGGDEYATSNEQPSSETPQTDPADTSPPDGEDTEDDAMAASIRKVEHLKLVWAKLFARVTERLCRKEAKANERKIGSDIYAAWCAKWYAEHVEDVKAEWLSVATGMAETLVDGNLSDKQAIVLAGAIGELAELYRTEHVKRMNEDGLAWLIELQTQRPPKLAYELTELVVAAVR